MTDLSLEDADTKDNTVSEWLHRRRGNSDD
jgi:hypothetical protein